MLFRSCVYPPVSELRTVCREIAVEVAGQAVRQKVAKRPVPPEQLGTLADARMWVPRYVRFTRSAEPVR